MHCAECGADFPGAETCLDRFHHLLAAETDNAELRKMHGLTVLTYHLQHPSLTKPWFQIAGAEMMRRIFGQGEDWSHVLMELHPRGVGRRRAASTIVKLKTASDMTMPDRAATRPIAGELTITSIDLSSPAGQSNHVLNWARAVADHRFLQRSSRDRQ